MGWLYFYPKRFSGFAFYTILVCYVFNTILRAVRILSCPFNSIIVVCAVVNRSGPDNNLIGPATQHRKTETKYENCYCLSERTKTKKLSLALYQMWKEKLIKQNSLFYLWVDFLAKSSPSVSDDSEGVVRKEGRIRCGEEDERGSVVLEEVVDAEADGEFDDRRCSCGGWWWGWTTTTTVEACEVLSSSSGILERIVEWELSSGLRAGFIWSGNFGIRGSGLQVKF